MGRDRRAWFAPTARFGEVASFNRDGSEPDGHCFKFNQDPLQSPSRTGGLPPASSAYRGTLCLWNFIFWFPGFLRVPKKLVWWKVAFQRRYATAIVPNQYRPLKGRPTFDSTLRVSNGPNRSPNGEPVVMPILLPVSGLLLLSSPLDCHSNSIVTAERSEGGEAGGTKSKDPVQCHERSLPQHSIGFQMRSSTNRASASHGSAHHGTLANLLETP